MTYLEEEMCTRRALREIPPEHLALYHRAFRDGFEATLDAYGVWKDGVQYIGALDRPIKEEIHRQFPPERWTE